MNKETPTVKEKAIYQAVVDLFMEGADLSGLTVSEITAKAGIGKGTAYGYFSDKEDMIARSICYNVDQYCHWIYQGIAEQKTLYEKIDFLLGNKAVRSAVETILPYCILLIEFGRDRITICLCRHCLMECSIEYSYHRCSRH